MRVRGSALCTHNSPVDTLVVSLSAWWDASVSASLPVSVSGGGSPKVDLRNVPHTSSASSATPPTPAPHQMGSVAAFLELAHRVTGCCAGSRAEGMKYSCSTLQKKEKETNGHPAMESVPIYLTGRRPH